MRATWLERWQDVICLTVSGGFVALVIILGDKSLTEFLSAPYIAAVMFALTWVVTDFLIAFIITRRELRDAPPPRLTRPPARVPRARLPRAVARLRR